MQIALVLLSTAATDQAVKVLERINGGKTATPEQLMEGGTTLAQQLYEWGLWLAIILGIVLLVIPMLRVVVSVVFGGKALAEAFRSLVVGFFSLILAIVLIIFAPKIVNWIIHFVQDPQAATSGLAKPPSFQEAPNVNIQIQQQPQR